MTSTPKPRPDSQLERMLLGGVMERVERVRGRLTARFDQGWWHVRLTYYTPDGQWLLATGTGKTLTEALTECLADAEKQENM